ncbi:MAG: GEVED domain-containing protein, partial [Bacteroidales bacterium]
YYYGDEHVKFWIDYNHDNVFDIASELVGSTYCSNSSTIYTVPLIIPASALTGATTLRALTSYSGYLYDLCGYNEYGNCSDFQVNILPSIQPPTVTTAITTVSDECTAVSGGDVTDVGGSPVTERGVCWGLLVNPVSTDFHTTDGTGIGSFVSDITGLIAGATYHVRAYATNTFGTTYGDDLTISTPAPEITGIPAVCAGSTTTLACTQTGGTWSSGSTSIATIDDPSIGLVTGVSMGQSVITFTYVNTNGCTCSVAVTVTVSISPASPNPVTATPSLLCDSGTSILNGTSNAGSTILWYTSPTEATPIGGSASGADFPVLPPSTTTYYAEAVAGSESSHTFDYSGSIVPFTVPFGVYSIVVEAKGAQGGAGTSAGGLGAYIKGAISVTSGQVLNILVGGQGGNGTQGGGGGGSFVTDNSNNPLIVAGGGGGGHAGNSYGASNANGSAGNTGNPGIYAYGSTTGGSGGSSGSGGGCAPQFSSSEGAGGGGLLGNGSDCYGTGGGKSFVNGGAGGYPAGDGGAGGF